MPRLRRADCSTSGITRRRRGRGWVYADALGRQISDRDALARIEALVLPPAWRDVWICPYPNGHLQAVGTDAAGRRQYRYHDEWRRRRDAEKHDSILEFAAALPAARLVLDEHLRQPGLTRQRVLAAAVRLLDDGFLRIGGEVYAEANNTFGLATIRKEHVRITDDAIGLAYRAKHGKQHEQVRPFTEESLRQVVLALKRRRGGGPELLAYRRRGGWVDVRSTDINSYLREELLLDASAKSFRTWNATVMAAVGLAVSLPAATSPTTSKRAVTRVVKEVATKLGNTPAVCRASYIDPRVIELYQDGITIAEDLHQLGATGDTGTPAHHGPIEAAVAGMLRDASTRHRVTRLPLRRGRSRAESTRVRGAGVRRSA